MAKRPEAYMLQPESATLLLIDWQTRLFDVMPTLFRNKIRSNAENLLWIAQMLEIPTVQSEQYPRGLGPSLSGLNTSDLVEKTSFSAMATPEFAAALQEIERKQIILTGMETHICVAQTCRDLLGAGYDVWVVADAVLSRRSLDWRLGIESMRLAGASITTTEALLFSLLRDANNPYFKEASRRIR